MTYLDVYIGHLSDKPDPLDRGGDWNGNQPSRISPMFPPTRGLRSDAFRALQDRIDNGRLQGKQVDWGAWAANVSKADIELFIAEIYGEDYDPKGLPHLKRDYDKLKRFVETLSGDQRYALVAVES